MQVNGEGLPTGTPPAGSGDPNPPANTGVQGDPATTTTTPPGTDPPPGSGQQKDPEDLDGLKKSLEASRAEQRSATARARESQKQLDEANKRLKDIDDAQKSELDRATEALEAAKREALEANERARTTTLRYEISRHATAQNFADPEDAYLMLDTSKIEYEEDGTPKGVEALVKELGKAKPYLLKDGGQQPQQNTNQAPKPTPQSALTGTQTPPDIDEKHKAEQFKHTRAML